MYSYVLTADVVHDLADLADVQAYHTNLKLKLIILVYYYITIFIITILLNL